MITKDNIKLIEATMYIDRDINHSLKEKQLNIQERWRKVLVYNDIVIDIKTGEIVKPAPTTNNRFTKLFTLYYKNIYELQKVTDDDLINALTTLNSILDKYLEPKEPINIMEYKKRKRTLK